MLALIGAVLGASTVLLVAVALTGLDPQRLWAPLAAAGSLTHASALAGAPAQAHALIPHPATERRPTSGIRQPATGHDAAYADLIHRYRG
jgi:hypothetical protein